MAAAQQHAGAAQADNQRVQALHDYTNVTAPLDGVVVWRYADTGALIQGGTNSNSQDLPIVRLSQSALLRLRVPVPEDDVRSSTKAISCRFASMRSAARSPAKSCALPAT